MICLQRNVRVNHIICLYCQIICEDVSFVLYRDVVQEYRIVLICSSILRCCIQVLAMHLNFHHWKIMNECSYFVQKSSTICMVFLNRNLPNTNKFTLFFNITKQYANVEHIAKIIVCTYLPLSVIIALILLVSCKRYFSTSTLCALPLSMSYS